MANQIVSLSIETGTPKRLPATKYNNIAVIVLLLSGAAVTMLPFVIMFMTAITKDAYQMSFPVHFIPNPPYWANLIDVWRIIPLGNGFLNSIIVSVTVSVVGMLTSSMAAFAFAKLDFPGREKIFMGLLSTMMIPYAVLLIPQFIGFSRLHWVDTLNPIIVPGLFGNIGIIFFLRQSFRAIPDELIDAGKIDGASFPRIYGSIILPLGKPAIAAQMILSFMGCWNDFFGPMIYLNTPERQTVQVLITNFQGLYNSNWSYVMSVGLQAMLPLIILFIFAQRYIIESLAITGIKG